MEFEQTVFRVVGGHGRWGKSKCGAMCWLSAVGCTSFDFAEALACLFICLSVEF
jgi:hypothetical protein